MYSEISVFIFSIFSRWLYFYNIPSSIFQTHNPPHVSHLVQSLVSRYVFPYFFHTNKKTDFTGAGICDNNPGETCFKKANSSLMLSQEYYTYLILIASLQRSIFNKCLHYSCIRLEERFQVELTSLGEPLIDWNCFLFFIEVGVFASCCCKSYECHKLKVIRKESHQDCSPHFRQVSKFPHHHRSPLEPLRCMLETWSPWDPSR